MSKANEILIGKHTERINLILTDISVLLSQNVVLVVLRGLKEDQRRNVLKYVSRNK
jgi:hypothetical protein